MAKEVKKQEITSQSKPKRDAKGRLLPGYTANPYGKPEGAFSLLAILKAELQKCPEGQDKKTYADLIVKRMLKEAIEKGDQQQIKLIWNYIEGLPRQPIDIGTGDLPFTIKIEKTDGGNNGNKREES